MTLHITSPSREKDRQRKDLPALKRYSSETIRKIKQIAEDEGEDFFILSRKYGMIRSEEEIPFNDEQIREKTIPELITDLRDFLECRDIDRVIYYDHGQSHNKPYFRLLKNACETLDIDFEKKTINS
jgi:hypothetical protein